MNEQKSYGRINEHGVHRVGASRVMLDSVLAAFHQGHSPETIRQHYPVLSLEEVFGSLAYYLGHKVEVNAYLQCQEAFWKEMRARAEKQPNEVVERLRALRRAEVTEAP